jgi:hypothetical protein
MIPFGAVGSSLESWRFDLGAGGIEHPLSTRTEVWSGNPALARQFLLIYI